MAKARFYIFNIIGILFLVFVAYIVWTDPMWTAAGRGGIAFLCAVFCLLLANIDRFEHLKASYTGIEASIRADADRAENAVLAGRRLAVELGKLLVTIVTEGGRWPQESARDMLKSKILDQLKSSGLSGDEIREIETADAPWVIVTYVGKIFSHAKQKIDNGLHKELDEFQFKSGDWNRPSAKEIKIFLEKYNVIDGEVADWLDDYAYYLRSKTHRRPDVWAHR